MKTLHIHCHQSGLCVQVGLLMRSLELWTLSGFWNLMCLPFAWDAVQARLHFFWWATYLDDNHEESLIRCQFTSITSCHSHSSSKTYHVCFSTDISKNSGRGQGLWDNVPDYRVRSHHLYALDPRCHINCERLGMFIKLIACLRL